METRDCGAYHASGWWSDSRFGFAQPRVPIAGNMAGGTHHAFEGEGAGYCIFNDLAVCAEIALQQGQAERVLILDLDVHQGRWNRRDFSC